jgi:ASCH domain protein
MRLLFKAICVKLIKMKAITIKQPWASLIVHGIKDIENRTWPCPKKYLGQRVLIHASGKPLNYDNFYDSILTNEQLLALPENKEWKDFSFCTGSIIGSIEIVDCVQNHSSIWAEKEVYNWVLANPILFESPIENVKGRLSLVLNQIPCYLFMFNNLIHGYSGVL